MSEEERLEITKFISLIIENRVLLAQPIGSGSIKSQANEGLKMMDEVSALVIKPSRSSNKVNFFGSKYALRSYSPKRHDRFYINYINQIINTTNAPIIFHDQPFGNGIGLSSNAIREIYKNKSVFGFKLHTQDLNHLKNQYQKLNKRFVLTVLENYTVLDFTVGS